MAVLLEATLRDNKQQKVVFSLTFSSQHTVCVQDYGRLVNTLMQRKLRIVPEPPIMGDPRD